MKLLFVNPVCLDPRVTDADATVVPQGLYYLAAQMLDAGFEAAILNLAQPSVTDPDSAFAEALDTFQPDFIGFSVTNPTRFSAMSLARTARQMRPQTVIVFGGPAPTFMVDYFFPPARPWILSSKGKVNRPACTGSRPGWTTRQKGSKKWAEFLPDSGSGVQGRKHAQAYRTGPADPGPGSAGASIPVLYVPAPGHVKGVSGCLHFLWITPVLGHPKRPVPFSGMVLRGDPNPCRQRHFPFLYQ